MSTMAVLLDKERIVASPGLVGGGDPWTGGRELHRGFQLARGLPAHQVYNTTLYILAAFLLGGLLCNLFVRPVAPDKFMSEEELARERLLAHEMTQREGLQVSAQQKATPHLAVALAWIAVAIPLCWGIWTTIVKSLPLFR